MKINESAHDLLNAISAVTAVPRQALLVLGMHRSGTSALTRVLSLLGAKLPAKILNEHQPAVDNERGHWEPEEIMLLHEEILESAGSKWDAWEAINPQWFESDIAILFKHNLIELLKQNYVDAPLFVVKEPRLCRLIPLWQNALSELRIQPKAVLTLRNPLDVAASLEKRDGFSPYKSYLLWLRHVLDAERQSRNWPRAIVTYDQLLKNWQGVADHISQKTGIVWPRQSSLSAVEIDSFLTPNLRHHSHSVDTLRACPEVADWVKKTYGLFIHAMEDGESSAFYDDLDEISSKFDEACHAFGRLVTAEEKKLELVQQQQVSTRAELDCVLQQLHQTQAQLEQSEGQLHQTQAQLEQ